MKKIFSLSREFGEVSGGKLSKPQNLSRNILSVTNDYGEIIAYYRKIGVPITTTSITSITTSTTSIKIMKTSLYREFKEECYNAYNILTYLKFIKLVKKEEIINKLISLAYISENKYLKLSDKGEYAINEFEKISKKIIEEEIEEEPSLQSTIQVFEREKPILEEKLKKALERSEQYLTLGNLKKSIFNKLSFHLESIKIIIWNRERKY